MKQWKDKIWLVVLVFGLLGLGFLHSRVEDERYFGLHEFESYEETADISEGVVTVSDNFTGVCATTPVMGLKKGSYELEVSYQGPAASKLQVLNGEEVLFTYELPMDQTEQTLPLTLTKSYDSLTIRCLVLEKGGSTMKHINLRADGLFYNDSIFAALIAVVILITGVWYFNRKSFEEKSNFDKIMILMAVALAVFLCYPLFNSFLNYTHDLDFHLSRIEGIKDGILSGHFPVYIYPEDMKCHGRLGCLYPNLFLYIPAFLRVLGVSAVTAYKTLIVLINLATIAASYYAIKQMTGSKNAAWIGMFLYTMSPYRISNIYIRAVIGECLAMVFLPLVLVGLYHIFIGNKRKWYLLVIGMSGIIESHILSTVVAGVLCACFALFFLKKLLREGRLLALIKAVLATTFANALFFVPLIYYCMKQKLRVSQLLEFPTFEFAAFPAEFFMMHTSTNSTGLLYEGIGSTMTASIGCIGIAGIIMGAACLLVKKDQKGTEEYALVKFFLLMETLTLFFASTWFPWTALQKIPAVYKIFGIIQFPWRIFAITTLVSVMLTVIVLKNMEGVPVYRYTLCGILIVLTTIGAVEIMDLNLTGKMEFQKMSGDIAASVLDDYIPDKADLDNLQWDSNPVYDKNTGIEISGYQKYYNTIQFQYSGNREAANIKLPLFYYTGYEAKLGTGEKLPLMESEDGQVMLTLPAAEGIQDILVGYHQPWIFYLAYLISIAAVVFCVFTVKKEGKEKQPV